MLFGELDFPLGEFYALQTVTQLPQPPAWTTVVGQGYRLLKSDGAPELTNASLNFNYFGELVPPGEENFLKVYFYDGSDWQVLDTTVEPTHNLAIANVPGPGIYVLMSSYEIALYGPGWNNFAYPVQASRPVSEALQSIAGNYSLVYGYVPTATVLNRWQVYAPDMPDQLNTLATLDFGNGYWINITDTTTLYLKGAGPTPNLMTTAGMDPPATYYGVVEASSSFTPRAGLVVTAKVNGQLCGQGQTFNVSGQIMYRVIVLADSDLPGCGTEGRTVALQVAGQGITTMVIWSNTQVGYAPLKASAQLFLPLVRR